MKDYWINVPYFSIKMFMSIFTENCYLMIWYVIEFYIDSIYVNLAFSYPKLNLLIRSFFLIRALPNYSMIKAVLMKTGLPHQLLSVIILKSSWAHRLKIKEH